MCTIQQVGVFTCVMYNVSRSVFVGKYIDYVLLCRIISALLYVQFMLLDHNVQFLCYHEHFTWLWA